MEDLKQIFLLDKFAALTTKQKLAVLAALATFAMVFTFALASKVLYMGVSAILFYLACKWVGRSGISIEE